MRDRAAGKSSDPAVQELHERLRAVVRDGTTFCPISASTFLEFMKQDFVCGANLPSRVMSEFRKDAKRRGQVSGSDALELGDLASRQVRAFDLEPCDVAEEYFKLALDCGIWVSHALRIGERVKKIR